MLGASPQSCGAQICRCYKVDTCTGVYSVTPSVRLSASFSSVLPRRCFLRLWVWQGSLLWSCPGKVMCISHFQIDEGELTWLNPGYGAWLGSRRLRPRVRPGASPVPSAKAGCGLAPKLPAALGTQISQTLSSQQVYGREHHWRLGSSEPGRA